jgi:hypothetical protein
MEEVLQHSKARKFQRAEKGRLLKGVSTPDLSQADVKGKGRKLGNI